MWDGARLASAWRKTPSAVTRGFLTERRLARFAAPAQTEAWLARPRFGADLPALFEPTPKTETLLARGAGGAGGDVATNSGGGEIDLTGLDRIIRFDPAAGLLRAQAGLSVLRCLAFLAPRGHFLPVTPAWGATTLGGMVATDGHGANHDAAGSIGAWVRRIKLHRSDRAAMELAPGDPSGLFEATIGGLGLTGVIEWVELETRPIRTSMMDWEAETFATLNDYFALSAKSQDWVYRRAWLDASRPGRGRFERYRHAQDGPVEARAPQPMLHAPAPLSRGIVNGFTASVFAGMLERRGPAARRRDYASVVFPYEDAIEGFGHLFGRRGGLTYQCALPKATAPDALAAALNEIKRVDDLFILISLHEFGARASPGLISFAREGLCLTVRMRQHATRSQALCAKLDAIVADAGGRLHPAHDARAPLVMVQHGYPNLAAFEALIDPRMRSDFCRRVAGA